jgi:hypothetical protein
MGTRESFALPQPLDDFSAKFGMTIRRDQRELDLLCSSSSRAIF